MKPLKITLLLAVFLLTVSGQSYDTDYDKKHESIEKKKNDGSIDFLVLDKNHKKPSQQIQA